jgi:group II intron reverse transcriptase/maturase
MAKWVRWSDGGMRTVLEMRNAETVLAIIRERGKGGKNLEDVYRQLYNPDLYLRAYGRISRNAGAMTKGSTGETVDGMSMEKIGAIIEAIRCERYRWTPVRRVLIPKSNGKMRPLGIPTWSDKLLQEVMRSLMEAYYEPQFSDLSHGFRPGRGCHTALREIHAAWKGTVWYIEGDIKGCFDNIDHSVLLSILREKIQDNRFLALVERLLKAGYLEQRTYRPTLSGTPQGGIVSPLLANIYLDRLDKYVEGTLIPEFTRGGRKKDDREYGRLRAQIRRLEKRGEPEEVLEPLRRKTRTLRSRNPLDPDYRRLHYIRYADDFMLGLDGPKEEAEAIKGRLRDFLRDHLKLELSPEKTLVTHGTTESARFLGYEITRRNTRGKAHGQSVLSIPNQVVEEKIRRYSAHGRPIHRPELINESDLAIIDLYGQEFRGFAQYYAHARNRFWLNRLQWYMRTSLLKTLARKHKSTVSKMAARFAGRAIAGSGVMRCISVTVKREGKPPLYARFGGISLKPQPFMEIEDRPVGQDRAFSRTELIQRLRLDECELCGSRDRIQAHHVRMLADLKAKGRKEIPTWKWLMIARRRKTLIVCLSCHTAIHAGRPTRARDQHEAEPESRPLESRVL